MLGDKVTCINSISRKENQQVNKYDTPGVTVTNTVL
jgi:hypothetical protein